jgi:hypothetical protein
VYNNAKYFLSQEQPAAVVQQSDAAEKNSYEFNFTSYSDGASQ